MIQPTYEELERKVARLELLAAQQQESESNIQALFHHSPLGLASHRMVYDPSGKPIDLLCLAANPAFRELTGTDPTGRLITAAFPGIDQEPFDWTGSFGRVVATGEPLHFKHAFQVNNRWYEGVAFRSMPDHFAIAFCEITAAKLAEESLRESDTNYQQLVDAMQEQLLVVRANGEVLFANQRAHDFLITEGRVETIRGCNIGDLLSPDQAEQLLAVYGQVIATNSSLQQRILVQAGSGSRWFDNTLTPIHYGTPPLPAVMSLMLDITDQRAQQESLRQSEAQYRTLFESMQEGVVYFKSPTAVLSMNPAAQRIMGYSPAELQHRLADDSLWQISYDDGPPCTLENNPITRCFVTGQAETGTIFKTFNPQRGRDLWIVANVTPQFSEYGTRPTQVIATFNDITDRIGTRESRKVQLYLLDNIHRWSLLELLQQVLDKVGGLTGSPLGSYYFVDEEHQTLTLQMWSSTSPAPTHRIADRSPYPLEQTGIWLDCLRQRRTVIDNDSAASASDQGKTEGRPEILRELVTPIFRDDKIIALLGMGNKACPYNEEDASLVQHFADLSWNLVEQKQMEEERRQSQQKLKALISNLPGMAFSVVDNAARTLHFVSDGCLQLTGYSAQELLTGSGASLAPLTHPEDRSRVLETIRSALAENKSYEVEYRLLHVDGRERVLLERGAGIASRSSSQLLIEGFATDITEQKHAAQRIAESHQQLLTILDSLEAQIFVADMKTHQVLFVNRKMQEVFGPGVKNQSCYRAFQGQDRPCDFCTNDRLLDEQDEPGPVCQWEHLNPVTGRWYVNYDRAVRWINGKMVRMQIAFDNTERKETELKLRQVQKMEAIGLLAGGVAHDFNNILSVILGYATMALDALGENNLRVKRDILQIQKAGLRARDLSRQILTFSHQSEENFHPLKLPLIVKEVIKMLRSSFPATIHISAQIAVIDQMVLADPSQIHQVLMNLCTNALHAMKDGGELTLALEPVHLEGVQRQRPLQELPPGPYLRLSVRDTGTGIPEDIQEKIFDPFFTTKLEGEGTGLGLAVVQGIVASHKGAVTVDSMPGNGTTFSLYLPESTAGGPAAENAENPALPGGEETILIIDDEPAVAEIIQRLLQTLGYATEAFSDSAKAFEAYARNPTLFDLVITDMTMPKFTGLAIARAMLAMRPEQLIIICTGYSDAINAVSAQAEGVRELLDKPVSLETLARTVRRTLDRG